MKAATSCLAAARTTEVGFLKVSHGAIPVNIAKKNGDRFPREWTGDLSERVRGVSRRHHTRGRPRSTIMVPTEEHDRRGPCPTQSANFEDPCVGNRIAHTSCTSEQPGSHQILLILSHSTLPVS